MSATAARRIPARDLLTPGELAALRERVEWKGIALIAHAWAVILGSIALVALFPNPLTYIVAVVLIGSRQLGLAILMHDGAHGCLSRNAARNMALSQWFCAYPVFAETAAYRRYHLTHHARTQQDDDPDLVLSAPFPITKASYRRKFWRDITGQTGYEQRKAQILNALGDPAWPWRQRPAPVRREARAADRRQCGPVRRTRAGRRLVGLSAALARSAAHLDDGDHAHPQHRRACGGAGLERSAAQYADHQGEPHRARAGRAVFRQLSPRASPALFTCPATICRSCTRS